MCMRGDIFFVDFGDHGNSHKQSGIRPAVIVSNNRNNRNSPVVTVVPLSARVWKKKYLPTHVQIPLSKSVGLDKPSMALAEQVETLDKAKLGGEDREDYGFRPYGCDYRTAKSRWGLLARWNSWMMRGRYIPGGMVTDRCRLFMGKMRGRKSGMKQRHNIHNICRKGLCIL